MKTYSEMMSFEKYEDRVEYLRLCGIVGYETFGHVRYLNQHLYQSREWKRFRLRMIKRDMGNDAGHKHYPIDGMIILHHINPITPEDFENNSSKIWDEENVICVSAQTHKYIHYGRIVRPPIIHDRKPNDHAPWLNTKG